MIRAAFRLLLLTLALTIGALPALAQDDVGRLTRLLQDSLSGAGRTVTITGFRGALSSNATMERMTIADDQGVWLTMTGASLRWNRGALLAGMLDVSSLTAEEITITRFPQTGDTGLPAAEAQPFALPQLPVSIAIGEIAAKHIRFGPEVFGAPVDATLSADASLIGGQGHIRLALDRTDGTEGKLSFIAVYENATNHLTLAIDAKEAAGGLVVSALGIPGAPPAHFLLGGEGPLDGFSANLKLDTDGQTRLAGAVSTSRAGNGATGFTADLSGNMAPLLLPEYGAFFGDAMRLQVEGQRQADGALKLSQLDLTARAMRLDGALDLSPDGLPDRVAITGDIGRADGAAVLLPLPGEPTRIGSALLSVSYDRQKGPDWTAEARLFGLVRDEFAADRLDLTGTGQILHGADTGAEHGLKAKVALQGQGLKPADPALAQALGPVASLTADFGWTRGDGHLKLRDLALTAGDATFTGFGTVAGLTTGFRLDGEFALSADDLTRFAPLTGMELSGQTRTQLTGWISPLSGQFDAEITAAGQDLKIGTAPVDGLLAGVSSTQLSARRDETGIALRQFDIVTESGLDASVSGKVATAGSDVAGRVALGDLSVLGLGLSGQVSGAARFAGTAEDARVTLTGTGQDLAAGQRQLDALVRGTTALDVDVRLKGGTAEIAKAVLSNPAFDITATGRYDPEGSDIAADLRLPDLSVLGLGASGGLEAKATLTGKPGDAQLTLTGTGQDLAVGQKQIDALGEGTTALDIALHLVGNAAEIAKAQLSNPAFTMTASGTYDPDGSDLAADVSFPDLTILGLGASGALTARATLVGTAADAQLTLTGTGQDLAVGQKQIDALGKGTTALDIALQLSDGVAEIARAHLTNPAIDLTAAGRYDPAGSDLTADFRMPDLAVLGTGAQGALAAKARVTGTPDRLHLVLDGTGTDLGLGQAQADALARGKTTLALDLLREGERVTVTRAELSGPRVAASARGSYDPAGSDLSLSADLPDLSVLGLGYRGAVQGQARLTGTAEDLAVDLAASSRDLALGQPILDRLLAGAGTLKADLSLKDRQALRINGLTVTAAALSISASGPPEALAIDARLGNLGLILPEFPGPLTAKGMLKQTASGTGVDFAVRGPGQIAAQVQGALAPDFASANLTAKGTAQAGLANALIAPRVAAGPVSFDLALRGPFSLNALSGTVRLTQGRMADPALPVSLVDATAEARLSGGSAAVTVDSGLSTGGRMTVTGRVGLTPPMPADLAIRLTDATIRDPQLYSVTMDGNLTFKGPALGGGMLAGTVNLSSTELRVPSASIAPLPVLEDLRHVHDSAEVRQTRARAGMDGPLARRAPTSTAFGLNLLINARNQVFIRGRGLDAELGGQVRLTGTTAAIVPAGQMELIRGRLDLLGKRLVLNEATLQLQGALVPWVRIAATTTSDEYDIAIRVEGDAFNPEVTFTSSPELPQEEVIARLLFNSGLQSLSPFQLAQLASAVATLAGTGGEGILGRIRNSAGLVNLDVVADSSGNAAITAGSYLTDKLYSEVTVGQDGQSVLNLNLDVSRSITLRGTLDDNGESSLGVVIQKDY